VRGEPRQGPERLHGERLEFRERVLAVDASSLDADDQITLAILHHKLDFMIGNFEGWYAPGGLW
jgi:hypothetical protein